MPLRKLLLWLMLASLALSAVAGVLAVLVVGQFIVWRVVGSGVLLAVTFGIMLAVSLMIDTDGTRWAGIVGVATCGIGALFFLDAIWGDMLFAGNWRISQNLIGSGWAVTVFGGMATCSLVGAGPDRRWWRLIGVAASGVAFGTALYIIWEHIDTPVLPFSIIFGIAAIVAHANLAFNCNLQPGQKWVRWGTVGAVILASVLIDINVGRADRIGPDDFISRSIAATLIAAACGTLALFVLARMNRKNTKPIAPAGVKELAIACPWCKQPQTVPVGASKCSGCGLKFQIAVEEPHCPNCDYLLYMLGSDRCPECGTLVHVPGEVTPPAIS